MSTTAPEPPKFDTDDGRWEALCRRDRCSDGQFFYAVTTTGIYCRPTCPSRLARRENVRFFQTTEQAERAGFRGCRRCKPQEAPFDAQRQTIERACQLLATASEPPSLQELAEAIGLSPFHFHRLFKKVMGVTPKAYATAERARRLREELPQREQITEAIYRAGYSSSGRFYSTVNEQLGMTPSAYRSGGEGEEIRFAIGESSLGSVLVAATAKGVCAILLGDDPDYLARDLQDRFPRANLIGADADFEEWVARAVGLVENPTQGLGLALDIRGTAFQIRVWEVLKQILPGTTLSYREVAERLGDTKAARAVAKACGANPLAIAIPCHRVVRQDESLSGYRWGVERKAALLKREQENVVTSLRSEID